MTAQQLLIGDLSARTGCHIETIRFYERIALLPRAKRRRRYRCYGETESRGLAL
jgi:MerR family transcriptional regulator, mercuric resistance operon regulatory protein